MRKFLILGILILMVVAGGCSKGPAEAALKAAEMQLADAQPAIQKYVPEQYAALAAAVTDAKTKFNEKKYDEALAAANAIPPKVQEAMSAAAAKKEELTAKWNEIQVLLPEEMKTLTVKVDALAGFRKLPKGIDQAGFDSAKASMTAADGSFNEANAAFSEGNLVTAVEKALVAKGKADEAAKLLEPINVGTN